MASQISEVTGQPSAPHSIRVAVSRFLNEQEVAGFHALLFHMDYLPEDENLFYNEGVLALTEYHHYTAEVSSGNRNYLSAGDQAVRTAFQHPTLLRISEERMLPIGLWFWNYADDTLTYLGK